MTTKRPIFCINIKAGELLGSRISVQNLLLELVGWLVGWLAGWLDFQTQAADRRAKRVSGGVLAAAQLAAKSMMEDGRGRWRSRQVSDTKKHEWQPNDVNHGNLCRFFFFACFFGNELRLCHFLLKKFSGFLELLVFLFVAG